MFKSVKKKKKKEKISRYFFVVQQTNEYFLSNVQLKAIQRLRIFINLFCDNFFFRKTTLSKINILILK